MSSSNNRKSRGRATESSKNQKNRKSSEISNINSGESESDEQSSSESASITTQSDYTNDISASSGELEVDDIEDLEWSWEATESFASPENIIPPKKKSNTSKDFSKLITPNSFFEQIISSKMLQSICDWTNAKAEAKRSRQRRDSHEKKWTTLTVEKLRAFFGVLILMSIVNKRQLKEYWSSGNLTKTPGISNIFSRDEFTQIKRMLIFYDMKNYDIQDPFYRISPLIKEIIGNTNSSYSPSTNLALDETMIAFKGRSKFRVYMPMKPIRYGFKVYSVSATEHPIILNFKIHDGTSWNMIDLVQNLLAPYEGSGHVIFMDRYYMSPKLVKALELKGFGTVGTCQSNRLHIDEEISKTIEEMPKYSFHYYQANEVLLTVWKDEKPVFMLSNTYPIKQLRIVRRKKKNEIEDNKKVEKTLRMPISVCVYNDHANGVDIVDQYLSNHMFNHRSIRWYFRIMIYLIEISILNSWCLYQMSKPETPMAFRAFRRLLAKNYIYSYKTIEMKPILQTPVKGEKINLQIKSLDLLDNCHLGKAKKGTCTLCKQHQTSYRCEECELNLCLIPCYDLHLQEKRVKCIDSSKKIRIIQNS